MGKYSKNYALVLGSLEFLSGCVGYDKQADRTNTLNKTQTRADLSIGSRDYEFMVINRYFLFNSLKNYDVLLNGKMFPDMKRLIAGIHII